PPERLGVLKAPAGLDIGAETPEEIAVSILAEIVQHQRSDKGVPPATATAAAIDPVCGMTVDIATARYRSDVAGATVYFCCRRCEEALGGGRWGRSPPVWCGPRAPRPASGSPSSCCRSAARPCWVTSSPRRARPRPSTR